MKQPKKEAPNSPYNPHFSPKNALIGIRPMARANRHFIPGQIWHLTHRCHKREFLLKFARDRKICKKTDGWELRGGEPGVGPS